MSYEMLCIVMIGFAKLQSFSVAKSQLYKGGRNDRRSSKFLSFIKRLGC